MKKEIANVKFKNKGLVIGHYYALLLFILPTIMHIIVNSKKTTDLYLICLVNLFLISPILIPIIISIKKIKSHNYSKILLLPVIFSSIFLMSTIFDFIISFNYSTYEKIYTIYALLHMLLWVAAWILTIFLFVKLCRLQKSDELKDSDLISSPGWYPDQADPSKNRYWNGSEWTDNAPSNMIIQQATSISKNSAAIVSPSVFAILSLIFAFFMPILAIVFGHLALSEIRRSGGTKNGQGLAQAGLIIGYIGLFVMAICLLFFIASWVREGLRYRQ